MRSDLFDTAY